jgi:Ca2+-dependent lipid-binding protein
MNTNSKIGLKIRCENLERKDFNGKSDPFLVFLRKNEKNEEWEEIHKTDYFIQELNPQFNSFELSIHQLTNGKSERKFKIKCFDWNINKKYSFIGEFEVSVLFFFYFFVFLFFRFFLY